MDIERLGDAIGRRLTSRHRSRGRLWAMKDGSRIRVKDMTDEHVLNARAMAVRNNDTYWITRFTNEIAERATKK